MRESDRDGQIVYRLAEGDLKLEMRKQFPP